MREQPSAQTCKRLRAKVPVTWREKGISNVDDWATFHSPASNVEDEAWARAMHVGKDANRNVNRPCQCWMHSPDGQTFVNQVGQTTLDIHQRMLTGVYT